MRIERGAAGGLPSLPDPRRLVEAFREGGLAALVQTREQRALMDEIQAAMAVVEGYSEHVMDALGERAAPRLRAACARRWSAGARSRSAPERVLQRLLGLDMKMRQYEQGKRFCDAVVAAGRHRGAQPGLGGARGAAHAGTSSSTAATAVARAAPRAAAPRAPA